MKRLKTARGTELLVLQGAIDPAGILIPKKPSACLVYADDETSGFLTTSTISAILESGCLHFALLGPLAPELENSIDYVIEDNMDAFGGVVTSSHLDEPVEKVLSFLMTAIVPGVMERRFILMVPSTQQGDQLVREAVAGF